MHRSAGMSLTPKINLSVRHVTPMGADFSLPRGRFATCFPFLMEANPLALGFMLGSAWNAPKCTMWGVNPRRPRARRVRALSCKPALACEELDRR